MTSRLFAAGPAGVLFAASFVTSALATAGDEALTKGWPGPRAMTESLHDVWGEAALKLPGGPSFEAFRDLLPPVRYTNARFRDYPVVLSAPAAAAKARWVSNGSAVNARADKAPMWKEFGWPVSFHIGKSPRPFGSDPPRCDGPRYRDGYLPVIRIDDREGPTIYEQEAFAPVRGPLAAAGAVFVRFSVRGAAGSVTARLDEEMPVSAGDGSIRDAKGQALVLFEPGWTWDGAGRTLRAEPSPGQPVELAVLTRPLAPPSP